MLIVDGHGSIRALSESLARVIGRPVDELDGRPVWSVLTGWTPYDGAKRECALRLPVGRTSIPAQVAWQPLYAGDEILFMLELQTPSLCADSGAGEAIMITNRRGEIQHVNRAFEAMTGFAGTGLAGKTPAILKSGMHHARVYRQLWETLLDGRVWHGTLVNRRKDGELYREDRVIRPVCGAGGHPVLFFSSGRQAGALAPERHVPQPACAAL